MLSDIEAARPLAVLDEPQVEVVGCRIVPGDVRGAVAGEVARERRLITRRMRADIDAAVPLPVGDLPQIDIAGGRIEPEHVTRVVTVEVAEADRLIAGRM